MYSKVQWDAVTAKWLMIVQNQTTGQYWSDEFSFNPDLTTGEYITEVYGGAVPPIGGIPFASVRWFDENGASHTVNDGVVTAWQTTLVDSSGGCVVPSGLTFDDTFTNQTNTC